MKNSLTPTRPKALKIEALTPTRPSRTNLALTPKRPSNITPTGTPKKANTQASETTTPGVSQPNSQATTPKSSRTGTEATYVWENSGNVEVKLNPDFNYKDMKIDTINNEDNEVNINIHNLTGDISVPKRYMMTSLTDIDSSLRSHLSVRTDLFASALKANSETETPYENTDSEQPTGSSINPNPASSHQNKVLCVGRIAIKDEEGTSETRLSLDNIVLESLVGEIERAYRTPLNLSKCPSYSLFPGQVIGVEGTNPSGQEFLVENFVSLPSAPLPETPLETPKRPLQLAIASGPFTLDGSLKFEPLTALVATLIPQIEQGQLDALVLTGPFLSETHSMVKSGRYAGHEAVFQLAISKQLTKLLAASSNFKIIMMPSLRDCFHPHITLPQPPITRSPEMHLVHHSLMFCSNPAQLDINGIHIAASSDDILLAMSQSEISLNHPQSRLPRLANHLIEQRNLAPMYPVPECLTGLDIAELEALNLPTAPHLLIIPSRLKPFVQIINEQGTIAINPGPLGLGTRGGTYAKLFIPILSSDITHINLASKCQVEILKV